MNNRLNLALLIYGTAVLLILFGGFTWMIHMKEPCLELYGVGRPNASVDDFLFCEHSNMELLFLFQLIAVAFCFLAAGGAVVIIKIYEKFA